MASAPTDPGLTRAILTDFGADASLEPLLKRRSLGSLPAGGKSIVQFWCERLAAAGYAEVQLVIQGFPDQIRDIVEGGERWGLKVSMSTLREGAQAKDFLAAASGFLTSDCLIAPLHSIPSASLQALSADDAEHAPLTGVVRADRSVSGCSGLNDALFHIDSPGALWQANMDILEGKIDDPLPAGFEAGPGLRYGQHTQIREYVSLAPPARIGSETQIGERGKIGPNVMIGAHCVIDQACEIRHSLILDHSFIGSHAEMSNAIVDGKLIIKADSGVATWIDDELIVHHLLEDREQYGPPIRERLFALLLGVLLLPLMLLAGLVSLLRHGRLFEFDLRAVPAGKDLAGEATFRSQRLTSFALGHAHWRRLPWLFSAALGRIGLFGISSWADAEQTRENLQSSWAREIQDARPGMITLAELNRLNSEDDDDTENILITNSYFLATRSTKTDLQLLWRWLVGLFRAG